jgi:spermidine/putrescine transport system substrate-binding protein
MHKNRIALTLAIMALTAALALLGTAGCQTAPKQTVINVYNWGEYISNADDTITWMGQDYPVKDVIAEFEAVYPQYKVNYQNFDDNEKMYAKLDTEIYDVIVPSDYMVVRLLKEDRLLQLDKSKLTNVSQYLDSRLSSLQFDEDTAVSAKVADYAVPYMFCTVGLMYNQEELGEINATEPADVWSVLFDPALKNRVGMYSSMRETIGVALNYKGYSLNTLDNDQLNEAKQLLIDQSKNVQPLYGIDELKDKFVSGELLAGVVWSGDHVVCQQRLEEDGQDPEILQYILPKGSNMSVDMMCVPKNAANPEGALAFINFMYQPDIALMNAVYVGYSSPHTDVQTKLPTAITGNPSYYPDAATIKTLEVYYSSEAIDTTYDKLWQVVMAN